MIFEKNGTGACGSNYCYWQAFEYMFVLSKGKPKAIHRLTNGKPCNKLGPGSRINKDGSRKKDANGNWNGRMQIRNNIWKYNVGFTSGDERTGHPAVFPTKLAEDHILSWSNEGDVVLDPFMGSGTTGVAAISNGRDFIGIEISPEYAGMAIERINRAITQIA